MEEPPGGHAAAEADQVTRLTAETVAARGARTGAWIFIGLGMACILFAGLFFSAKYSGHDVVATVTHEGPCSNGTCTVDVVYNAAGRQVTAVMYGVNSDEIYGSASRRLLNINYQPGYESDPTTNDMPNAVWISFGAAGLACVGWGAWWRLRRKASPQKLTVAAPGEALAGAAVTAVTDHPGPAGPARVSGRGSRRVAGKSGAANPGLYPDPGGQPGLRRWDGRQWSPFLLQADPASAKPGGVKAPAEVWSPLAGSEPQWHDAAGRVRRAGIMFAVWLAVTAAAAVVTVALYARDLSKPQADFTLAVFALIATVLSLLMAWNTWTSRKNLKKIDQAAKAAAAVAGTADSTASPIGDRGEGPVAG